MSGSWIVNFIGNVQIAKKKEIKGFENALSNYEDFSCKKRAVSRKDPTCGGNRHGGRVWREEKEREGERKERWKREA